MGDADRERELLRAALGRTPQCPDIETLAAASPSADVQRHAASCERCRAELALLHQFEGAEPSADEAEALCWVEGEITGRREAEAVPAVPPTEVEQGSSIWFRGWRAFTWVAACAAVAVVVTVYQSRDSPIRSAPSVYRSTQVVAISPTGDVTVSPSEFRWQAVAAAAKYHLRLLEVDGTVVWESDTPQSVVRVPAEISTKLTPGRAFQWDVTAYDGSGKKTGASTLQSFHILATNR